MDQHKRNGFYKLRNGLTIYPNQIEVMDEVLADLQQRCPAKFILLTDTSGLIVSSRGETGTTDLVGLGSLIAGDLAASQEIARITGQYQNYELVLRVGPHSTSLISEAGRSLVLFVQISSDVPLGWARILISEASRKLAQVMENPPDQAESFDLDLGNSSLADLIGDSLDSMWTD